MAQLRAETTTGQAPYELQSFCDFVGADQLARHLRNIRKKLHNLSEINWTASRRYAVPIGLANLYGKRLSDMRLNTEKLKQNYHALAFVAQVNEVRRHIHDSGRKKLRGRVLDALKPDRDARWLSHELRAAFFFSDGGWDIEFTDLEDRGRHDLTIRKSDNTVEVECKVVTGDTGAAIHAEEADRLFNMIIANLEWSEQLAKLLRLDIITNARLPKEREALKTIAELAIRATNHCDQEFKCDGASARAVEIVAPTAIIQPRLEDVHKFVSDVREEHNAHCVFAKLGKNLVVMTLRSDRASRLQNETLQAMRAASNQLSKSRRGILWTHFADLPDVDLARLSEIDQAGEWTGLSGIANKIFISDSHKHIAAVLYSAAGIVKQRGGQDSLIIHPPFVTESGRVVRIWNKNCILNRPFVEFT